MKTQLEDYVSSFIKAGLKIELIKDNNKQVLFIYHEDYFGGCVKSKMVFDLKGNDIKDYKEPYSLNTI